MARQRGVRSLISAGLDRLRQPTDQPNVVHGSRKAHIVAVAAQKGGVGKTTTSVNLACALAAHHDQRVLLVDIDPQGHVSSALRDSVRTGQVTLSQVLLSERPRDLLEAAMESAIDNVHLTPPDKALNESDTLLSTRVGREYFLQGALTGARTHYDTIVVDCPPNLGNLTLNALVAADAVLIPCDMSILAFEGVADMLATVETVNLRLRQQLRVLGILRTRVDRRTRQLTEAIDEALRENYGDLLLETSIPINSALAKAQAAGLSIFQYDERCRGAEAYRALANELVASQPQQAGAASAR